MPAKRIQVPLDDGWSVITHSNPSKSSKSSKSKPHRKTPSIPHPKTAPTHQKPTDTSTLFAALRAGTLTPREYNDAVMARTMGGGVVGAVIEDLTVEKLGAEFERLGRVWRSSACRAAVVGMLEAARGNGWSITEAVAFGTGSFSLDWAMRGRALWQLVVFVDVVTSVKKTVAIRMFAQDPLYTPLDSAFLASLGIAVETEAAKSHLTPSSFLYVPFVDWRILNLVILPGTDPALYIGNLIQGEMTALTHGGPAPLLEEANEVASGWLRGREGRRVPEFEGEGLEGLWCCWRREKGEGGEG